MPQKANLKSSSGKKNAYSYGEEKKAATIFWVCIRKTVRSQNRVLRAATFTYHVLLLYYYTIIPDADDGAYAGMAETSGKRLEVPAARPAV